MSEAQIFMVAIAISVGIAWLFRPCTDPPFSEKSKTPKNGG